MRPWPPSPLIGWSTSTIPRGAPTATIPPPRISADSFVCFDEPLTPTLSRRERAIERRDFSGHLLRWVDDSSLRPRGDPLSEPPDPALAEAFVVLGGGVLDGIGQRGIRRDELGE